MNHALPLLPLDAEIETRAVLRKLARAHQALAELKGIAATMPNETILINTLALQEAKDSSAIENIITTQDELFRSDAASQKFVTVAAKEVHFYANALRYGFEQVRSQGLLTNNHILKVQSIIEENSAGFRTLPGTALKNEATGEVIYSPPQDANEVVALMENLERFMNDEALCDWDPLTKMAVIHHQFESIHPFYDGNGRTGRIINILYLVQQGLLKIPVLYLSRYINQNKGEYYRLLQAVRLERVKSVESGKLDVGSGEVEIWEDWILFMLEGVEQTSRQTIVLVDEIKRLMWVMKQRMRDELPKIYSQDLLNNLFRHPYTKIEFVTDELQVHRNTAMKYLDELVRLGLLSKHRFGKENYYINDDLFELFLNVRTLGGISA
ncbi:MAG: Fic family protein [Acaryochloris sp. RU_4_1]|nr:Fic family protein [Acaryochloris sp. RU_4_1]